MARHVKCINCGIFNTNEEYCTNCGALLSHKKRRKIAFKKAEQKRKQRKLLEEKINPSFFERHKSHNYFVVRVLVSALHSIWLGFMAIGAFIAWLFTAIAA